MGGLRNGLRLDHRTSTAFGSPEGTDDDFVLIERVVDVASDLPKIHAPQAGDHGVRVRRPRAREHCQDLESLFEFSGEDVGVISVLKPPGFLAPDVFLGSTRKSDEAWSQRERISLSTSSASTSRPAATSASDSRRAL